MKQKMRSILAVLLSVMLALTLVPMAAFAEGTTDVKEVNNAASFQTAMQEAVENVTSGKATVINITADIEMGDTAWPALNPVNNTKGTITVNGNNHTITGLRSALITGTFAVGPICFNDLTIQNSTITGGAADTLGLGAFVGMVDSTVKVELNNCHVIGCKITGADWTGGLIGYAAGYSRQTDGPVFTDVVINNCSVENCNITGAGSTGGLMGHATGSAWTKVTVNNTNVLNNTITCTDDNPLKAGSVFGTIGAGGPAYEGKTGGTFVTGGQVSGNTVTANGVSVKRMFGRIGTAGGILSVTGGTYDCTEAEFFESTETDTIYVRGTSVIVSTEDEPVYSDTTYVAEVNGVKYRTLEKALKAAEAMTGEVTVTLLDDVTWRTGGSYHSTPMIGADSLVTKVTIEGQNHTFTATGDGVASIEALNGATLVFKNMTIIDTSCYVYENGEGAWEFTYLEFEGNTEFENVAFDDGVMFRGTSAVLNNCTFSGHNNDSSDQSNVTMYGAWVANGQAAFTGCTFTGTRGLKMHEAYGTEISSVAVDNCVFDELSEKPGIVIGTLNETTAVTVQNCTFDNCQAGDGEEKGSEYGVPYMYETDTPIAGFTTVFYNNTIYANSTTSKLCDHIFADWTKANSSTHERTCTVCGYVESESHNFVNDVCQQCRYTINSNGGFVPPSDPVTPPTDPVTPPTDPVTPPTDPTDPTDPGIPGTPEEPEVPFIINKGEVVNTENKTEEGQNMTIEVPATQDSVYVTKPAAQQLSKAETDTVIKLNQVEGSAIKVTIPAGSELKTNFDLKVTAATEETEGEKDAVVLDVEVGKKDTLPAPMKFTAKVTEMIDVEPGDKVYVYTRDEDGNLTEVANHVKTVSKAGNVTIPATDNGEYVILTEPAEDAVKLVDTVSSKLSSKTVKKGKSVTFSAVLPNNIAKVSSFTKGSDPVGQEEATITYKSSDPSIATVSKNGKITAKKAGKVKITMTIKLENGQKKTITKTITVK